VVLVGDFHLSSQGGVGYAPRLWHTKDIKNEPTAALFSVKHLRVKSRGSHCLLTLEPPGHGLKSQLGWLPLGTGPLSVCFDIFQPPQSM
jgi:hypothetical protein